MPAQAISISCAIGNNRSDFCWFLSGEFLALHNTFEVGGIKKIQQLLALAQHIVLVFTHRNILVFTRNLKRVIVR